MRVSWAGDQQEAYKHLGLAQHELFKLKLRMSTQGQFHGSFPPTRLSDTAYALGYKVGEIEAIHIVARPPLVPAAQPGLFYFEFATSGYPVITTEAGYRGCVVGVGLDTNNGVITPRPTIRTGERQDDLSDASLIGRTFDARLVDRSMAVGDDWNVYGQSANPYTGIYAASANQEKPQFSNTETGAQEALTERIVGQEFESNVADGAVTTGTPEGFDRPRATGIQEAGGRLFVVYIDAFNKVVVFPIDDATNVRSANIEFPVWAFQPTASADTEEWKINAPDLDWKLNHLGTKAVCVLHERESVEWDDAYLNDPDTSLYEVPTKGQFVGQTGTQDLFGLGTNEAATDIYTFGRGIFEIEISITANGPSSFSVSLSENEVRTPRDSDRGTFMVDYAWSDVEDVDVLAGDMILLDIERWYQPAPSVPNRNDPFDVLWIDSRSTTAVTDPPEPPGFPDSLAWQAWYADRENHGRREIPGSFTNNGFVNAYGGVVFNAYYDPFTLAPPVEWNSTFVTGEAKTFFSLRKQRAGTESEIIAIEGEALLGCSLKTLAVAIGLEYVERVDRTVPIASDATPTPGYPGVQTMPHVISHPGVAIYTQGALRKVLTPAGASAAVVSALEAMAATDPRAALASGSVRMAANDLRDWSGLSELRDFQIGAHYLCELRPGWPHRLPIGEDDHPLQVVPVADRNWWLAMCAYSSNKVLLFVTNPNFGWALYTSEAMHRMQMANNTFFSHPNGSWAFYDENRIYNTFGLPDIFQTFTEDNRLEVPGKYGEAKSHGILYTHGVASTSNDPVYFLSDIEGRYGEPAAYSQMRKFVYDGAGPVPTFTTPLVIHGGWAYGPYTPVYHPDYITEFNPTGFTGINEPAGYTDVTISIDCLTANIWNTYNTVTPAVQANGFTHCIFDHVHFEHEDAELDTTFAALYAQALGEGVDGLRLPTAGESAAVCTAADVDSNFELTIEWPPGETQTVYESAYRDHWELWYDIDGGGNTVIGNAPTGAGKLLKYRLLRGDGMPPTFSTCLMLDF